MTSVNPTRNAQYQTGLKNTCNYCDKLLEKINRCSRCKLSFYCNRTCQKKDWKKHKVVCNNTEESRSTSAPFIFFGIGSNRSESTSLTREQIKDQQTLDIMVDMNKESDRSQKSLVKEKGQLLFDKYKVQTRGNSFKAKGILAEILDTMTDRRKARYIERYWDGIGDWNPKDPSTVVWQG